MLSATPKKQTSILDLLKLSVERQQRAHVKNMPLKPYLSLLKVRLNG